MATMRLDGHAMRLKHSKCSVDRCWHFPDIAALNSLKSYASLLGNAADADIGASFEVEAPKPGQSIDDSASNASALSGNGPLASSKTGSVLVEFSRARGIRNENAPEISDANLRR